ncbi:MAG: hom [Thermoleophilia bacterium]|nr:hom [Thermoleophilia bacterium]
MSARHDRRLGGVGLGKVRTMTTALAPVRVALLGHGTVGGSLRQLLLEHRDHVRLATGRDVEICAVLVRDPAKHAVELGELASLATSSLADVVASAPDVVCEAMGGLEPTRGYLLDLLGRGIPVVTANKQLVARHGTELFARAAEAGAQLRFEASVCGALPIVRMLRESLAATRIERLLGILNGTTNYMLSAMEATGASYDDALADAQRLGYAEPDPTEDVEGLDAAAKLAILAGIAFGTTVDVEHVRATGISGVRAADVAHAALLGCRIRLIGRAERVVEGGSATVLLDVTPVLVPISHPLATIVGATNAVLVDGAPFGRLVVQGAGAGGPETASALAGDLVSVMGSEPSFLTTDPHVAMLPVASRDARRDRHYVRMQVVDRPGVLATVAGALAALDISIERVLQQASGDGHATLVLTTHPCTPGALETALAGVASTDRTVLPLLDEEPA